MFFFFYYFILPVQPFFFFLHVGRSLLNVLFDLRLRGRRAHRLTCAFHPLFYKHRARWGWRGRGTITYVAVMTGKVRALLRENKTANVKRPCFDRVFYSIIVALRAWASVHYSLLSPPTLPSPARHVRCTTPSVHPSARAAVRACV